MKTFRLFSNVPILGLMLFCIVASVMSQSEYNPVHNMDPLEIRLEPLYDAPQEQQQRLLRRYSAWPTWSQNNPKWRCIMGSATALPHRAFGPAIAVSGNSIVEKAQNFATQQLDAFGIEGATDWVMSNATGKHDWAFATQKVEGIPVEGSRLVTKWWNGQLVMWGADWFRDAEVPQGEILPSSVLSAAATAGVTFDSEFNIQEGELKLLPVKGSEGEVEWHLIQVWQVSGRQGSIPRRYETYVDVHDGAVLMRQNRVLHIDGNWSMPAEGDKPDRVVHRMGLDRPAAMVISGALEAQVHEMYPYEDPTSAPMPMLFLPLNGGAVYTDAEGGFISSAVGPQTIQVGLAGRWSTVFTNGNTPTAGVQFNDGYNNLDFSILGNLKERSAYRSTSRIHDHMKQYMPNFTDLDISMTTNIDVTGDCNAFYDGSSINFYDIGGGCNATSLIADVVWHEYGHGINDFYYSSLGAYFNNGAMGEGYADLWAMSLGDIAEIGKGFYTDNQDGIRRYDQDPKVYPEDLVGEVHADGEIICGAWYDTHLLLGGDWPTTMALFVDAYAGLQATAPNGSEGQAFTDVLIDALQADDDDGDLSNGTPNDLAIVEGFDIHGISVFSYAEIDHDALEFTEADASIEIAGETDIVFPYSLYFDAVRLWYQTESGGAWSEVEMVNEPGTAIYVADIPAQDAGTAIAYYMGITDDFGGLSAVTPFAAANDPYPNVPYYVLVGVEAMLINDSDEYSDFGNWITGIPAQDNATTGIWEEAIPVGSYAETNDPSTIVAPVQDHTLGFAGYAFVTGVNPDPNGGIGVNDVDGGHTTLMSPVIDLTPFESPIMTYWRWYTNAPPTGANPASDWWQVELSSDGGQSWQYFENTLQQDVSWRRVAFRVSDVIEVTDSFRMRFIASDSTTIGEYLDGGSLIEAAVDDIILYDIPSQSSVDERPKTAVVAGYPNPAHSIAITTGWMPGSTLRIFEAGTGKWVASVHAGGAGRAEISVEGWAQGTYIVSGSNREGQMTSWSLEVQR